jgi:hypothetical protein
MPRKEDEEVQCVHIWLYARDVERLDLMYGNTIGRSKAVRAIIRKTLNQIEAKASLAAKPLDGVDLDPELTVAGSQSE